MCLAFYVCSKIVLYLFLLERATMIRNHSRLNDPYYLIGVFVIVAGLGTIAIIAFIGPEDQLSAIDEICRIGLPDAALISLLTYDTIVNFCFTGLYVWLTNSITRNLSWASVGKVMLAALPFREYGPLPTQASLLELMMAKSLLGTAATVVATVVNLAVLIYVRGHEQGWICFTVCSVDGGLFYHCISNAITDNRSRLECGGNSLAYQQSPCRPRRSSADAAF